MSLPIRYSPMAFYFWLSIVFLTPQVLQHLPHWRDLLRPSRKGSRDHHQLYPIPIAPLAQYHIGDLPYDLQTMLLYFSFLSLLSFTRCILSQPDRSQVITLHGQDLTIHFAAHNPCAHFTYHLYLRLLYLLQKRRKFSPELRLKFILSHHFALLRLHTFTLSCTSDTLRLIALSQTSISHSLTLRQETISLLPNHTHPSEPHRIYT